LTERQESLDTVKLESNPLEDDLS